MLPDAGAPLLILAGGRATRLGALSDDRPKFLAPVVGDRMCFADLQLLWARKQGFRDVRLSVGYRGEQIQEYCGDGSYFGLRITYAFDGERPLGTGGAVKRAYAEPPPWLAVLYGDTILDLDCRALVLQAAANDAYALMTVMADPPPGHARNAYLDGDRVRYAKARPEPGWRHIDYGFQVLSRAFVAEMPDEVPLDLAVPLEAASRRGLLHGALAGSRFWEINTPESLEEFRARFAGDD